MGITTTSPTPPWCGCGGCYGFGRYHRGGFRRLTTPMIHWGLRHHSPTPHGAAVLAVPSSDRHHDGGLAADSPIQQQIKSINHPTYPFHFIIDPPTAAAAAGKAAAVAVVAVAVTLVVVAWEIILGSGRELSDGGSPRVIVYGYDGLPMLPVAPPSPYYIPGPEEPQTPPAPQDEDEHELMFIQPRDLDFVPKPIYPEYIPLEDEHILSAEEQSLPPVVSPTAESPGHVAELDLEEDPEEYEDDEKDDGPDEDKEDEEEEEHLASADSTVVIPTDELTSISLPPEEGVKRLLAMPTPSPSPLTSLSPPSAEERLARCTAPAALPSPPLLPSLYPPPPVDHRDDILESKQLPHKRLCVSTLGSRYEVGESTTWGRGADYGFADTVEAEIRH
nr:hypothetical protein [Tanacetum cinerariifolium]